MTISRADVEVAAAHAEPLLRLGPLKVLCPEAHPWGWQRVWRVQHAAGLLIMKYWTGHEVSRLRAEATLAVSDVCRRSPTTPLVAALAAIGSPGDAWHQLLYAPSGYLVVDDAVWSRCDRAASIYPLLTPADSRLRDDVSATELGQTLARLHQGFRDVQVPSMPRWTALCGNDAGPGPTDSAIGRARHIVRRHAAGLAALPVTVIHGDARYGNAIRDARSDVVLVDLEFCRRDASLFDLASLLAPTRGDNGHFEVSSAAELAEVIEGYQSIGPELDRSAWAMFPTVAVAHFATVAIDLAAAGDDWCATALLACLLDECADLIADARRLVTPGRDRRTIV